MVRACEGGHTRYWAGGGEVRSRDVAGDGGRPMRCPPPFRRTSRRASLTPPPAGGSSGTPPPSAGRRRWGFCPDGWTRRCRGRNAAGAAGRCTGARGGRQGRS